MAAPRCTLPTAVNPAHSMPQAPAHRALAIVARADAVEQLTAPAQLHDNVSVVIVLIGILQVDNLFVCT